MPLFNFGLLRTRTSPRAAERECVSPSRRSDFSAVTTLESWADGPLRLLPTDPDESVVLAPSDLPQFPEDLSSGNLVIRRVWPAVSLRATSSGAAVIQ